MASAEMHHACSQDDLQLAITIQVDQGGCGVGEGLEGGEGRGQVQVLAPELLPGAHGVGRNPRSHILVQLQVLRQQASVHLHQHLNNTIK